MNSKKLNEVAVTINEKDRLFVIGSKVGYSCLGFDVCYQRAQAIAKWLGEPEPSQESIGKIEGYDYLSALIQKCRLQFEETGVKCPCELTPQLNGFEGKRVEVVDKWGEKRRFVVGRSTGWIPCHIELKTSRSSGGAAVMGAPFQSIRVV